MTVTWQAHHLRFTAFPTGVARLDEGWWQMLTGRPPDEVSELRKQSARREAGSFENGILVYGANPVRIDWLFAAAAPGDQEEARFLHPIGPLNSALPPFVSLFERWLALPSRPKIQRLAFGADLIAPVDTREQGYNQLSRLLPYVKLKDDSFDFFYQINRPRPSSSVSGLRVNRLSRWSVVTEQQVSLTLPPMQAHVDTLASASHLELDINTDAARHEQLSDETLVPLTDELVQLANEIADKGDIA